MYADGARHLREARDRFFDFVTGDHHQVGEFVEREARSLSEVVTLGTRDSSGSPMGRDSLFRGASITKPVTAALVMTLVEDGLVDLDAPVADLLPELATDRTRTPVALR